MPTGAASNKEETPATAAKESYSGGKEATKAPFTTAWLSQVSEVTKPQAQQPAGPTPDETAGTTPVSHPGDRGGEARQAREHPLPPQGFQRAAAPGQGRRPQKAKKNRAGVGHLPLRAKEAPASKKRRRRGGGERGGGKERGLNRETPPPYPPNHNPTAPERHKGGTRGGSGPTRSVWHRCGTPSPERAGS